MTEVRSVHREVRIILLATILTLSRAFEAFDYRERGPNTWWFHHPEQCDSLLFPHQSPVELTSATAEVSRASLAPLVSENFDVRPLAASLVNDGASVIYKPVFNTENTPLLRGGPLIPDSYYILDHITWHWGETDEHGSEHIIDGNKSPLEMQLSFYNPAMAVTYPRALKRVGASMTLAVQYTTTSDDNRGAYDIIAQEVAYLSRPGSVRHLPQEKLIPITDLLGAVDVADEQSGYFSYPGSMTRPPCLNTVTWIVSTEKATISSSQVSALRGIEDIFGRPLSTNSRPVQDLGFRRPIYVPGKRPR